MDEGRDTVLSCRSTRVSSSVAVSAIQWRMELVWNLECTSNSKMRRKRFIDPDIRNQRGIFVSRVMCAEKGLMWFGI